MSRLQATHDRRRVFRRRLVDGLLIAVIALLVGGIVGRVTAPTCSATRSAIPDRLGIIAVSPGPARWSAGVPTGWAAGPVGAVAAAAGYTQTATAPWFVADTARRRAAVEVMAAPAARARVAADQDRIAAELLDGPLGPALHQDAAGVLLRVGVLGYRLERASADGDARSATVALWVVLLYGTPDGVTPQTVWATTTVRLVWVAGDWRLMGLETTPGPVPLHGAQPPTDTNVLLAEAASFQELQHAPPPAP